MRINSVTSGVVFICAVALFIATRKRTREDPSEVNAGRPVGEPEEDRDAAAETNAGADAEKSLADGAQDGTESAPQ